MKSLFLLIFFILSTNLYAEDCFKNHIKDAILLNLERKELYSRLTDGRSKYISNVLINFEKLILFSTKLYSPDKESLPYQRIGLDITCDLFVLIDKTPPFADTYQVSPPSNPSLVTGIDPYIMARKLRVKLRENNFEIFSKSVNEILKNELQDTRVNCMLRHFLESMMYISSYAKIHHEYALSHNVKSPLAIHKKLIKHHLLSLPMAHEIDLLSLPLQLNGLPIICQDLPPIHFESN